MTERDDNPLSAALKALKKSQRTSEADAAAEAAKEDSHKEQSKAKSHDRKLFSSFSAFPGVGKALSVADLIWNGWARPVTRVLNPITRRIWRFYGWSYDKFAHVKSSDGSPTFSRNRAAFVTIALAAVTLATPFILVRSVIPAVSRTIYDAGMLATMKEDHLFLGRAELINPDSEIFQVMGCRDITGCLGGDNTTYYRLRDNVILDIKYWTTRFEPYDPAEIAGAMVSELNDCTITYYGRRSKALGWYPYIVSASCVPV